MSAESIDLSGFPIPQGRTFTELVAHPYEEVTFGTGASSWLTSSVTGTGGTPGVTTDPLSTTGGGFILTTPTSQNSTLTVQTVKGFQLRFFRSIKWSLDGFQFSTAGGPGSGQAKIEFKCGVSDTVGATWFQDGLDQTFKVRGYGGANGFAAYSPGIFSFQFSAAQNGSRNIAFELRGRDKSTNNLLVWQDDQVIWCLPMSRAWAQQAGVINPSIIITQQQASAVAAVAKVAQFRLRLERNT
jgi:hypothetical protein